MVINVKNLSLKTWSLNLPSLHSTKFLPRPTLFFFQFKLQLSHDGSGKGAALVAAVSTRLMDSKLNILPESVWIVTSRDLYRHGSLVYDAAFNATRIHQLFQHVPTRFLCKLERVIWIPKCSYSWAKGLTLNGGSRKLNYEENLEEEDGKAEKL